MSGKRDAVMVVMVDEQMFTVPEVAARLRVSNVTVLRYLRDGRLVGHRLGGTKAGWRIKESDLRRFLDSTLGQPGSSD